MHKTITVFLFFIALLLNGYRAQSQSKHSTQTLYPTYDGLVMAGYQGWFRAEGDGSGAKRFAYGTPGRTGIDMWPDVSEYEKTYNTPFKLKDGSTAKPSVHMTRAQSICILNG